MVDTMDRIYTMAFVVLLSVGLLSSLDIQNPSFNLSASVTSRTPTISADYPALSIEVNIPAAELRLKENGEIVRRFNVAVGQPQYPTPIRSEQLTQLIWNPWWFPPDSPWAKDEKVTPPGPGNPLGPVKMPLSDGVRMHGTTKDKSIGTAASHACIRMHNEDARTLAWILQSEYSDAIDPALLEKYRRHSGSSFYVPLARPIPVDFIYEPVEIEGEVLKLHRDWYHKIKNPKATLLEALKQSGMASDAVNEETLNALVKDWQNHSIEIPLSVTP